MNIKNQTMYQALYLIMLLAFFGCSLTGGDIIQTTTRTPGADNASGLSQADRAALENIKKNAGQGDATAGLRTVLTDKARSLTVAEYLQLYPDAESTAAADYRVGAKDVLNIMVYEEKDLSAPSLRVPADGYLSFPMIGRCKVDGLTVTQIEKLITQKLDQGYLIGAHVTVQIAEYNSKWFLVLGAVDTPGSYPLAANERVLNALSKAGRSPQAQKGAYRKAKIVRTVHTGTNREQQLVIDIDLHNLLQSADQKANLLLADKDTLFIPVPESYYILGEVKKPGAYPLTENEITLLEGIGTAGGFTNFAARNSTKIIRNQNGLETVIRVKVGAITNAGIQLREIILQPNDIIIVPQSFF